MTSHTVLLVDDEPEILDALRRTLRNEPCRIVTVTSAKEALRLLDAGEPPSILISDIDMPDIDGVELISRVRKSHPKIVRMLLTGVGSLDSAMRAINEGEVHRFLTKPWDKTELCTAIRDAIARADEAQAAAAAPVVEEPVHPLERLSGPPLSPRLRQTAEALLTGAREKIIADRLGVSPHTVHQYVKALYRRFGVASRAEFMAMLQAPARSAPEGDNQS